MLPRVLETEVMDTPEEASDYDAMDHSTVNDRFVADFLAFHGPCRSGRILDVGTGTARIPIALCRTDRAARVVGTDLSNEMLAVGRRNVEAAGLSDRIELQVVDAKMMSLPDASFESVMSNSIVHHIPDPAFVLREIARLVAPGGAIFVRDLARPASRDDLDRLVEQYAGNEVPRARDLFAASLHAALTVDELRRLLAAERLPAGEVAMTSDRHWTWMARRA